jgi:hypothetical protein
MAWNGRMIMNNEFANKQLWDILSRNHNISGVTEEIYANINHDRPLPGQEWSPRPSGCEAEVRKNERNK